jgi:hypothetical protein
MSSGSAMDALIEESLGALLRAAAAALLQSSARDAAATRDALAARAQEAEGALKEQCADPRKMSVRAVQGIVESLAADASKLASRLGDARQQQEQDLMASLIKDAVRAVQDAMSSVKDDLLEKQRKTTGDAVRKMKAAAMRQQQATENQAVAEAAQEFRQKEVAMTRRIAELTEQVEALTARAESAEGVVERSLSAADEKCAAVTSECAGLRRQLAAVEERHRADRAVRLNLEKAAGQRGAEFWRKQPQNAQIKPNKSIMEMRREENDLREKVRLAEAYNEKRRQEQLEAEERRRKHAEEQAALARILREERERKQREEEEAAAAAEAAAKAALANERHPLAERQGNLERLQGPQSDHHASALRKEQAALNHDRQQWNERRPLSPTRVSPRRSNGQEGWDELEDINRPQSPPRDRPRSPPLGAAVGGGHAAVSSLRQSDSAAISRLDSILAPEPSARHPNASDLSARTHGSGVFERSVAELNYSASVAEIFGGIDEDPSAISTIVAPPVGYNPNVGAVSSMRGKRRPHSAASALPGGHSYSVHPSAINGASSGPAVVASSGLPLQAQQGQQMPPPPALAHGQAGNGTLPWSSQSLNSLSASSIGGAGSFRTSQQSQSQSQSQLQFDMMVAGRGGLRGGGLLPGASDGSIGSAHATSMRSNRPGTGGSGGGGGGHQAGSRRRSKIGSASSVGSRRGGSASGRGPNNSLAVQRANAMQRYHREVLPSR